jgi:hypothetical protein
MIHNLKWRHSRRYYKARKTTGEMNKHASILGKMAKGKPKNYSQAERDRRRRRLADVRKKRWPKPS